jgi:hypothetical protein
VYLIPQPLARDDSNLIADTLVNLEVERELWVVSLDDDFSGLLNGFRTNTTHDCGCQKSASRMVGEVRKCENMEIACGLWAGFAVSASANFGWQAQHVTLQMSRVSTSDIDVDMNYYANYILYTTELQLYSLSMEPKSSPSFRKPNSSLAHGIVKCMEMIRNDKKYAMQTYSALTITPKPS